MGPPASGIEIESRAPDGGLESVPFAEADEGLILQLQNDSAKSTFTVEEAIEACGT